MKAKKIKRITKEHAVAVFGSQAAVAEALSLSSMAISKWKDGPIPLFQDLRLRSLYPESFAPIQLTGDELMVWIMEQMA